MTPYDYQRELARRALKILIDHKLVYLAMEERTGKTLTALLTVPEHYQRVLVVTKKKALKDWKATIKSCIWLTYEIQCINYESLHTLDEKQYFDLVILDEAHNYVSGYPKRSKTWTTVKKFTAQRPVIYLSATPFAQTAALLFNQFSLSSWSPWAHHQNFYAWYREYGTNRTIWTGSRQVQDYSSVENERVFEDVKYLFITKTRAELGFMAEPFDHVHEIKLDQKTRDCYNYLQSYRVLSVGDLTLTADSLMKLRTALHMLEGGALKIDENYLVLANNEKADYIKQKWGDSSDVAIMYHYIAEGKKLKQLFKHCRLLQGTSNAEGIDLSDVTTLVIYSQDWSAAKHIQRRARQANRNRTCPIEVHFLITPNAISSQVYDAVAVKKRNYTDRLYQELAI